MLHSTARLCSPTCSNFMLLTRYYVLILYIFHVFLQNLLALLLNILVRQYTYILLSYARFTSIYKWICQPTTALIKFYLTLYNCPTYVSVTGWPSSGASYARMCTSLHVVHCILSYVWGFHANEHKLRQLTIIIHNFNGTHYRGTVYKYRIFSNLMRTQFLVTS
jgi:hypothetical protein